MNPIILALKNVKNLKAKRNLVEATILDSIDDLIKIKATSRGLKHSTTPLVPVVHNLRVQFHRLSGVKPSVPSSNSENLTNPIKFPEANDELSYDGV